MESLLEQITLDELKPEVKMLTISEKIQQLEYAKRNLEAEYNDLMKKAELIDIFQRNMPLETSLAVAIHSIDAVLESLKKERG